MATHPPRPTANGHVMGDHEAHALLLQDPPGDDEEDELVVSVQVPSHAPRAPPLDASGTQVSLEGARQGTGAQMKRHSTASLRGSSWRLKYQDFLPSNKSSAANWTTVEHYSKLVDKANDWLKVNPDVAVKTCQTLMWMSHEHKKLGNSEQMVLSKGVTEDSTTFCVCGLRLWLVPQFGHKAQSITCTDVTPDQSDNVPSLVTKANRKIEQRQIKGRIITVETIAVPILNGKLDSRVTRWTEHMNDDTPFAHILRIFSIRDGANKSSNEIQQAQIDIKDVVPLEVEDGYEGFEDLVERTNTWLKDQPDVLVVNMQSLMAQSNSDAHTDIGSACFFSMPGLNSPNPVDFFRILRVVWMRVGGERAAALPLIYPFTYETFTPELVRHKESNCRERMEKMNETFSKVIAFLRNTGAELICAEMVYNPMQLYTTDNVNNVTDEIKFLYTIRLYLTGQIGRLDGSLRSIKRASIASSRARNSPVGDAASIHPGPIFLRSVVTRQFKYRWLILALSAISCMTVIVVVSVVYSNR